MPTPPDRNLTTVRVTDENREELRQQEDMRQDEIDAGHGTEDNLDAGDGDNGGEPRQRRDAADDEPAKPIRMSPSDQAREAISNRFKRAETVPFDGDMTKPENLYGEVAREENEPDPDADEPGVRREAEPQRQPQAGDDDKVHVIKVRGKEVRLTTAELLERASKVEAADSYLEESRDLLRQAKDVKAGRVSQDSQHHESANDAQDDEQDQDRRNEQPRRPEDKLKAVVEKIQFGDPEEAAKDLGEFIEEAADQSADKRQLTRLMKNDLAKAQTALKAFQTANPDIANDKTASVVMEENIYDIYREDIAKLGVVDPDKIPKDKRTLADWHRFYRVHGNPVSSVDDVLAEAKTRLTKWRGPGTTQTAKPAPRQAAPRVEVNVDRTTRREAIPNQPTRAVAPRQNAQAAPKESSRSEAVKEMRRARGQTV